ncbi:MAG: hypothetical protein AAB421_05755 [Patescibacteria group bacterium]
MVEFLSKSARALLLASIGFIITTLGLQAQGGATQQTLVSPQDDTSGITTDARETHIATACVPQDTVGKQDEIFFLSCGGLF